MIHFGDRSVGDGNPVFVTFEAGPTHDGVKSAKQLIKHAASAGADAIKFQILDPDRLVADRNQLFTYDILADKASGATKTVSEPLYDIMCRRALSESDWAEVKKYADDHGIAFFATIGFPEEVDMMVRFGCDSIKIASADITHFPLIKKVARTGVCVQIDTGNATIGEVENAIELILREGNENIIIHHCPTGYPAKISGINLNIIKSLRAMFPFPIAFSDHSPGYEMDIAAIAFGASLVEKTITLDRLTPSVEHIMSIEPDDMAPFVNFIKNLPLVFGDSRRIISQEERLKMMFMRRSVFAGRDL
jgi:sialic acid synthase SpsE